MPLLQLGNEIVNTEHIVWMKFEPGAPAKVETHTEQWDEDYGKTIRVPARKSHLTITLTALDVEEVERDYSAFHLAAASKSQTVVLHGEEAEKVWLWFALKAIKPGEEWAEEVLA